MVNGMVFDNVTPTLSSTAEPFDGLLGYNKGRVMASNTLPSSALLLCDPRVPKGHVPFTIPSKVSLGLKSDRVTMCM